jgi:hypothetical protein
MSRSKITGAIWIAAWIIGPIMLATGAGLGFKSLFTSISPSGTEFLPAANLATPAEIDRIISKSVRIDKDLTKDEAVNQLTAITIFSGGTNFTIFKLAIPQKTCGIGGCLYIISDRKGWLKGLQLIEISAEEKLFIPSIKTGCTIVRQRSSNSSQLENYEICKPSND